MSNELPDKFVSLRDGNIHKHQVKEESVAAHSEENEGNESAEDWDGQVGNRDSKRSDIRYRPRTRYPRRRLAGNSRNRSQDHDESRDLPLRRRMKIYRNRRPSK